MKQKDPRRYDDIIELPHYVSKNRKQMSMHDRAAQFSPFAALSGYHESIEETARLTDQQIIPDESLLNELNEKLQIISSHIKENPLVTITYFIPDQKKEGGRYENISFRLRAADPVRRRLISVSKETYDIDRIIQIESPVIPEDLFHV